MRRDWDLDLNKKEDAMKIDGATMGIRRLRDQKDWELCKQAIKNSAYIFDYIRMTAQPERTCYCWWCRIGRWFQKRCAYGS